MENNNNIHAEINQETQIAITYLKCDKHLNQITNDIKLFYRNNIEEAEMQLAKIINNRFIENYPRLEKDIWMELLRTAISKINWYTVAAQLLEDE